jgi:4-hydroxy-3-methylbut-2-enyl diphosphate reductase IspH
MLVDFQAVTLSKLPLADLRSYCDGVHRALQIVGRTLEVYGPPVHGRTEIVCSNHVGTARCASAMPRCGRRRTALGWKTEEDVDRPEANSPEKVAYVSQTTLLTGSRSSSDFWRQLDLALGAQAG